MTQFSLEVLFLNMLNPFDDTYFMKKALEEAQFAFEKGEVPVGAIITHNNQIIARSHNLTERLVDVTAHAEMQAITAAANFIGGKYLMNCTMYVTLEPCPMCAGALFWSQLSKLVFASEDDVMGYRAMNTKLHPKTKVESGILKKEASQLLKTFFIQKRNLN